MCKQQGNDKEWKAFISPLASLRRISNFLIIRWIIGSGSRRLLKEFGVTDVSGEPLSFTVSRIIHTDMKRINMYARFHWTQYATNGRLPITPSWLFNVSLARANILEKFRCLVITLPVVLYRVCRIIHRAARLSITFG